MLAETERKARQFHPRRLLIKSPVPDSGTGVNLFPLPLFAAYYEEIHRRGDAGRQRNDHDRSD